MKLCLCREIFVREGKRDNTILEFGCLSCVEVREPTQIVDEMIDHLSSLMKRWMPKRVEEMRR
jgi:hypothetical protein